jgi:hypothetical protein
MSFAAVAGAGVAAVGGIISSKKAGKAASGAEFSPVDVGGLRTGGLTQVNGALQLEAGGDTGRIQDALLRSGRGLAEGGNQQFADQLRELGIGNVGTSFNDLRGIQENVPGQALTSAGVFDQLRQGQNQFGQQGIQAGFGGPNAQGLTNFATGAAAGLLNQGDVPSFNQLSAERLSALRGQARPGEERAVNSKFQSLFNRGQLGSTGGAQQVQALAQAQEQADLGRVINSQDFANSQQNQLRNFQLQGQQIGSGLLGQAFGGIRGDQGQGLGLGQIGANLFSSQGQSEAARLGAFGTADQANISRGQRRLGEAQDIFGFGQGVQSSDLDLILRQLGGSQSVDQTLLQVGNLGTGTGAQAASAGANAGALSQRAGSPLGGALQGLGTGLGQSGFNLGSVFQGSAGRDLDRSVFNNPELF